MNCSICSKSTRDGLLEEDYHGQHHILDGMAVVSSTLNQLALLHNEEKSGLWLGAFISIVVNLFALISKFTGGPATHG